MKTNAFHTLVLHTNPDLEACLMAQLILDHEAIRDRLGVVDGPKLKFIPGGRLRGKDWPGEKMVTAEALEARGFLFLDCGGGRLDQHGKAENLIKNSVSSIDLLVDHARLDELMPHLMPVCNLVSRNDLYAEDVAPRHNFRKTVTPNTPLHLREAILGWNVLHKDAPAKVVGLARQAFGCIERCIDRLAAEGEWETTDPKRLFLVEELLNGATAQVRTVIGLDAPEDEVFPAVSQFQMRCAEGLAAREREWDIGVRDYWENATIRAISVARRTNDGIAYKTVTVAYGRSKSTRFGAVTRYGNEGNPLPFSKHPRRPKAEICVQFNDGRFVISTKGTPLHRVAKVIREADLKARGVDLSKDDVATLDRKGHLVFKDASGREQDALYFAEYDTAFGNGFRANPFAPRTPLREQEIIDLLIRALDTVD